MIAQRLSPGQHHTGIRSLVGGGGPIRPPDPSSALPPADSFPEAIPICFGENQLSPSLIGLSPLPRSHPSGFQPTTVRSSTACYGGFNLLLGRSPRLRVYAHAPSRPIQTRFRSASGPEGLKLRVSSNSLRHNAKGTPSADNGPKPAAAFDRL